MADIVDQAQSAQELHLRVALRAAGVRPRHVEIPPPQEPEPPPAFCRTCGGRPESGGCCGPCNRQIDKGP